MLKKVKRERKGSTELFMKLLFVPWVMITRWEQMTVIGQYWSSIFSQNLVDVILSMQE